MNFQKFSLREPLGGNPPDPHSQNHTTPLFSIHLRISRELTPPDPPPSKMGSKTTFYSGSPGLLQTPYFATFCL